MYPSSIPDQMNRLYLYRIFALRECLTKIVGVHYPKEIISMIIMLDYKPIKVGCGSYDTILVHDKIYSWGRGEYKINNIPPADIKSIHCGCDYAIALTNVSVQLRIWGNLSLNNHFVQPPPREHIFCSEIKSISCGAFHVIVLLESGKCYIWGSNADKQLGLKINESDMPCELDVRGILGEKESIVAVSCGGYHSIALTASQKCYVWGSNRYGQLGLEYHVDQRIIRELNTHAVFSEPNIISISCGGHHTVALTTDTSKIYVWGSNDEGQLGLGDNIDRHIPQELMLSDVVSIHCGRNHTMALISSGKFYVWGANDCGQLGLGHNIDQNVPKELIFRESGSIKSITCGGYHTVVVTSADNVYVWGRNDYGQLGLGDKIDRHVPTEFIIGS